MQAKAALPSCRARAPPMRLQCLHTGLAIMYVRDPWCTRSKKAHS